MFSAIPRLIRNAATTAAPVVAALALIASRPAAKADTLVQFATNLGVMWVQLYDTAAPVTVANFLTYVVSQRYDGSFIHRSTTNNPAGIQIVQGGGFRLSGSDVVPVPTDPAILNEASLSNIRGTIAMARTSDPNSATSQWFFNSSTNLGLDAGLGNPGYAVFGKVLDSGLSVLDAIAAVPVYDASTLGAAFGELPLLQPSLAAQNLVTINSITIVPEPSSAMLCVAGVVGMLTVRRRRRSSGGNRTLPTKAGAQSRRFP